MTIVREHATRNPFKHAGDGLLWSIRTQPNYRIHLIVSIAVIAAGIFFGISWGEWIMIVLLITIGLVMEALNTAIELTNNAITKEWKEEIKLAKDVAAAAMLTFVIGATIIAGLIFLPRFVVFIS